MKEVVKNKDFVEFKINNNTFLLHIHFYYFFLLKSPKLHLF